MATKHKIAVFFSGRVRGYEKTIDKLQESFFSKYDCDFFASIDQEDTDEYHKEFQKRLKPVGCYFEKYDRPFSELPVAPSECRQRNSLAMFYHNFYAMKMVIEHIKSTKKNYHVVVKFRLDIDSSDTFEIPDYVMENTVYIPRGNNFRGICDMVGYGDVKTMIVYGTLYMHIPNYIYAKKCFFSPEYLLNFHINENNMNVIRFSYRYVLSSSRHNKITAAKS